MKNNILFFLSLSFFAVGSFFFLLLAALWPIPQAHATWAQKSLVTPTFTETRMAKPTRIVIGSAIDLPVVEMGYTTNGWGVSPLGATFPSNAARPGENGNVILYSHNKEGFFGQLHSVQTGYKITVYTEDGIEHLYTVTQQLVTTQDDRSWVSSTDSEVLTMYTCTGFLDLQRLVIRATPTK